jgi:hypothetical protein
MGMISWPKLGEAALFLGVAALSIRGATTSNLSYPFSQRRMGPKEARVMGLIIAFLFLIFACLTIVN